MLRSLPLFAVALLIGCQNPDATVTVHEEEPYTPAYTAPAQTNPAYAASYDSSGGDSQSLDSLDDSAAYGDSSTAYTPAASSYDAPIAPGNDRVYQVRKGDTLYRLARQFYSDQARWRDIWSANRNRVPNPDQLNVGTKLIIP